MLRAAEATGCPDLLMSVHILGSAVTRPVDLSLRSGEMVLLPKHVHNLWATRHLGSAAMVVIWMFRYLRERRKKCGVAIAKHETREWVHESGKPYSGSVSKGCYPRPHDTPFSGVSQSVLETSRVAESSVAFVYVPP